MRVVDDNGVEYNIPKYMLDEYKNRDKATLFKHLEERGWMKSVDDEFTKDFTKGNITLTIGTNSFWFQVVQGSREVMLFSGIIYDDFDVDIEYKRMLENNTRAITSILMELELRTSVV